MIVIERARHPSMTRAPLDIGIGRELATTAIGRAHMAELAPPARADLIAELAAHYADRWPPLKIRVEDALRHFNAFGYTMSAGDWDPDYNAVGVPLRLRDGTCLGFNCGGSNSHITADRLPGLGDRLVALVATLADAQDLNPNETAEKEAADAIHRL